MDGPGEKLAPVPRGQDSQDSEDGGEGKSCTAPVGSQTHLGLVARRARRGAWSRAAGVGQEAVSGPEQALKGLSALFG